MPLPASLAGRMNRWDLAGPQYPTTIIADTEYASGAPMGIPSPSNGATYGSAGADPTTGRIGLSMLAVAILGLVGFYVLTHEREM